MKLIFAKPTYGPSSDQCFDRSHRLAIMHAANRDVSWVGDLSPDRLGWCTARNKVLEEALTVQDADGIFWVDDDIKIPIDTIVRLLAHKEDFVSALYFQRSPPYWPVFGHLNKKGSFEWPLKFPLGGYGPCDGLGFGCVYTSMRMVRDVCRGFDMAKGEGPFGGDFNNKTYGEDFAFCLRVRDLGYQAFIDTSIECEHFIGPEFATASLSRQFTSKLGEFHGSSSLAG